MPSGLPKVKRVLGKVCAYVSFPVQSLALVTDRSTTLLTDHFSSQALSAHGSIVLAPPSKGSTFKRVRHAG